MKVNKQIGIDLEIMQKLQKETNASQLINDLLIQHYNLSNKPLNLEEVNFEIKKLELEEEYKEKKRLLKQ